MPLQPPGGAQQGQQPPAGPIGGGNPNQNQSPKITLPTDPLIGGIATLRFIPSKAIKRPLQKRDGGIDLMLLEIKTQYNWIDIPALHGSLQYTEDEETDQNGLTYTKQAIAFIPHDSHQNRQILQAHRLTELTVQYTDHNGNRRLIGTPDEPLRLHTDFKTKEFAGNIGFYITFQGRHRHQSQHLILPELPQFLINQGGYLIYKNDLQETFNLTARGNLTVSGPNQQNYTIHDGHLLYN